MAYGVIKVIPSGQHTQILIQSGNVPYGSARILNPNDGVVYVSRNRDCTSQAQGDWEWKIPSQSYAILPGEQPGFATLGLYYIDQSGAGLPGEITVYPSFQTLDDPTFIAIGRAQLTAQSVLDIAQGSQPAAPGLGYSRLWIDNTGVLHVLPATGPDHVVLDSTNYASYVTPLIGGTALGSDLYGTIADGHVGIRYASAIRMYDSGGTLRNALSVSGNETRFNQVSSDAFTWVNQANNQYWMSLDLNLLTITGAITQNSASGTNTFKGRVLANMPISAGIANAGGSLGGVEVQPASGGGASMMTFHRPGAYAAYFGLDTDNVFRVGGWSMGAAAYRLILGDGLNNGGSILTQGNVTAGGSLYSSSGNVYLPDGNSYWIGSGTNMYMRASNLIVQNPSGAYAPVMASAINIQAAGYAITCISQNNHLYWDNSSLGQWQTMGGIFRHVNGSNGYYFDLRPGSTAGRTQIGGNAPVLENWQGMYAAAAANAIIWPNGSLISGNAGYVQGSQLALKQASVAIPDTDLLARVVDPRLPVTSYLWPDDPTRHLGFIADDVALVLPELVVRDDNGAPAGYAPQEMTAMLWGAVRALNERINQLAPI